MWSTVIVNKAQQSRKGTRRCFLPSRALLLPSSLVRTGKLRRRRRRRRRYCTDGIPRGHWAAISAKMVPLDAQRRHLHAGATFGKKHTYCMGCTGVVRTLYGLNVNQRYSTAAYNLKPLNDFVQCTMENRSFPNSLVLGVGTRDRVHSTCANRTHLPTANPNTKYRAHLHNHQVLGQMPRSWRQQPWPSLFADCR